MKPARHRYAQSLSRELEAPADRVRDLIGSKHWVSDGQHKEALLRNALRRHVPDSVLVSRGFTICLGPDPKSSKEQDLLVVDTSKDAPLFHQEGLVITLSKAVFGSVSVKTTFAKAEFRDAILGLLDLADLRELGDPLPWAGVYFFNPDPSLKNEPQRIADKCAEWLRDLSCDFDGVREWCVRVSRDHFCRFDPTKRTVRVSSLESAASAFFVARLSDCIADHRGAHSSLAQLAEDELIAEFQVEATL